MENWCWIGRTTSKKNYSQCSWHSIRCVLFCVVILNINLLANCQQTLNCHNLFALHKLTDNFKPLLKESLKCFSKNIHCCEWHNKAEKQWRNRRTIPLHIFLPLIHTLNIIFLSERKERTGSTQLNDICSIRDRFIYANIFISARQ